MAMQPPYVELDLGVKVKLMTTRLIIIIIKLIDRL